MTDYQILTIVIAILGLLVTSFGITMGILVEWIKNKE